MQSLPENDDSALVERCIARDPEAWSNIVAKYSGLIYAAIDNRAKKYGSTLPRTDIEDIMQGVITSIWHGGKLASVKNRKDISCWLAIVSGNAAARYLRDRKNHEIPMEWDGPAPEAESIDEETALRIGKAIDGLPPREKIAVQLFFFHGKKHKEISEILGMPANTVASHIRRAKARLKKKLRIFVPQNKYIDNDTLLD